ncbi:MAG: ribokinase [Christensenellaceae bacterium]|nr:ribokinase [Christensenellaceae bacterium]
MKRPIAVVQGSLNCDITACGQRLPKLGETVIGTNSSMSSGGKGANQAVQLAKMGAEVYMIGRVGKDSYGDFLISQLKAAGVKTDYVLQEDESTGLGVVHCDSNGQYYAMVIPNANGSCCAADVMAAKDVIAEADVMMCQLESTDDAMYCAAKMAKEFSVPLILNPAPAKQVDPSLFACAHTITPNETETAFYTKMNAEELVTKEKWTIAANRLLDMGAKRALITLGGNGSFYLEQGREIYVPAFSVNAVDTTAAGDAFNGAYAYAVATSLPLEESLMLATAAGALATQNVGAQASMRGLIDIKNFLKEHYHES